MESFVSKLSIHDLFAMLIPGCIIEYLIFIWVCNCDLQFYEQVSCCCCSDITNAIKTLYLPHIISFLTIGYLMGLINDSLMAWLFMHFRNNKHVLHFAHEKITKTYGFPKDDITKNIPEETQNCLMECEFAPVRYISILFYVLIKRMISSLCDCPHDKNIKIIRTYYNAYDFVAKEGTYSSYSHIERQVAFIRNSIIPLCFFLFKYINYCGCKSSCYIFIVALLTISLFFTMCARQEKVYEIIWEAYYTLKVRPKDDYSGKHKHIILLD